MALPGPHPLSALIGKYLSNCGRMLVDAQDERPMLISPLLFPLLEFFCGCLTQTTVRLPEPLTVFSLVFVRSVIECYEYKEEPAIAAQLKVFFSEQTVMGLAERLMTDFLCITGDDLQRWQQSGEEFFVEEMRCAWLERIRPAAEILMGTLLRTYTDLLSPVIARGYNTALASTFLRVYSPVIPVFDSEFFSFVSQWRICRRKSDLGRCRRRYCTRSLQWRLRPSRSSSRSRR